MDLSNIIMLTEQSDRRGGGGYDSKVKLSKLKESPKNQQANNEKVAGMSFYNPTASYISLVEELKAHNQSMKQPQPSLANGIRQFSNIKIEKL